MNMLHGEDLYTGLMTPELKYPRHDSRSNWTVFGYDSGNGFYPRRIMGGWKKFWNQSKINDAAQRHRLRLQERRKWLHFSTPHTRWKAPNFSPLLQDSAWCRNFYCHSTKNDVNVGRIETLRTHKASVLLWRRISPKVFQKLQSAKLQAGMSSRYSPSGRSWRTQFLPYPELSLLSVSLDYVYMAPFSVRLSVCLSVN